MAKRGKEPFQLLVGLLPYYMEPNDEYLRLFLYYSTSTLR